MQHLSTAFLIFALAIVVNQVGATAHFYQYEQRTDQLAQEAKNRAVTIIDGPKYVEPPSTPPAPPAAPTNLTQPDQRPPSKPPNNPAPDKHGKPKYVDPPRLYIGQIQNFPPQRNPYPQKIKIHTNPVYKYQKVIPLPPNRNTLHQKQQLVYSASTSKPSVVAKSPKFSLPIETINGIRADFVRPPHFANSTTTSTTTTTAPTTTTKYLRTKRIWPKHILENQRASNSTRNSTTPSPSFSQNKTVDTENDLSSSASRHVKIILTDNASGASSPGPSTRPPYRRVTRVPKKKPSTPAPANASTFEPNDWVPIVPSHYTVKNVRIPKQTPIRSRRSDRSEIYFLDQNDPPAQSKRPMFLHSFGLLPVPSSPSPTAAATATKQNVIYKGKTKKLKPHVYSGYRGKPVVNTISGDHQTDDSMPMKILTKIKHHHHHHHHRYVKTVEKPVRVEVNKPVPVPVPVPMPVKVEHKVPYPVRVNVPHPVPVKVIEKVKEYVPKPYPVVQQVPVEVIKHVEVKVPHPVPVPYEKRVPYPVKVEVPVPKPYPVAVPVEKKVPYPVPVRILVPQPYPVEKKVPVEVKEQVEVIKHVPVRVPVPRPYPVRVPQPVPVPYEKRVPYPVEVEKEVKVPVPYKVFVPEKVEVEKKVPVYVPRPYPVEKKVPVPVKVPYPVRVPVRVPVGVPIFIHPSPNNAEQVVSNGVTVSNDGTDQQQYNNNNNINYSYTITGNTVTTSPQGQNEQNANSETGYGNRDDINGIINTITQETPQPTITVHGRPGFQGFQSRSDSVVDEATSDVTTLHSTTPHSTTHPTSTELSTRR